MQNRSQSGSPWHRLLPNLFSFYAPAGGDLLLGLFPLNSNLSPKKAADNPIKIGIDVTHSLPARVIDDQIIEDRVRRPRNLNSPRDVPRKIAPRKSCSPGFDNRRPKSNSAASSGLPSASRRGFSTSSHTALPCSRLEPAELLQFFLLLHPAQFLRNRKQRQVCFAANFVSTCDFEKPPSRCGAEVAVRGLGVSEGVGERRPAAASASFTLGKMLPVAVTAPAAVSSRRRLMLDGKSVFGHDALLRTKGWRDPL